MLQVSKLQKFATTALVLDFESFKTSLISSCSGKDVVLVVVRDKDKTSEAYLKSSEHLQRNYFAKMVNG